MLSQLSGHSKGPRRNKAKTPFQVLRTRTWNPREIIILVDYSKVELQDSYKSWHCSAQVLLERSLSTWCVCLSALHVGLRAIILEPNEADQPHKFKIQFARYKEWESKEIICHRFLGKATYLPEKIKYISNFNLICHLLLHLSHLGPQLASLKYFSTVLFNHLLLSTCEKKNI